MDFIHDSLSIKQAGFSSAMRRLRCTGPNRDLRAVNLARAVLVSEGL